MSRFRSPAWWVSSVAGGIVIITAMANDVSVFGMVLIIVALSISQTAAQKFGEDG